MQLDQKNLDRLLSLSDRQLEDMIKKIGKDGGVDLSTFHITSTDAQSIRRALRSFTDADRANMKGKAILRTAEGETVPLPEGMSLADAVAKAEAEIASPYA